ncbi:hypothetical protein ABL78_2095 [Leptomonas seymouri]|uniref:Uncharacterized protein n=1 Tax=Leptomonas seymouri TaxID=5684 RepID=A0A0N1PEH6_LEPSE|nr:hypothetical protein ABL78_2095 [Leptomonas seymouri]|eukprot:KPI88780.1 hypothetical protein ABL78_2095 [Leptomonas seymouri]
MGGIPSREASDSIRTLRYGNHEIGLIPFTRQFFNKDNPELCQQFIRVRNDPNVRYCHMRAAGYSMDQLPPAEYSQEDLDALVDSVEESLFDTNEDFLNAGAGPVASFSVAEMHRILQREGLIDPFDPQLDDYTSKADSPASFTKQCSGSLTTNPKDSDNGITSAVSHQDAPSTSHDSVSEMGSPTQIKAVAANGNPSASPPPLKVRANNAGGDEAATPAQEPARNVESMFRSLKSELQAFYRAAEKNDSADYSAKAAAMPDLFHTALYRRFKRAVRPLPCAVVFIYVNSLEEHDCFVFRGHRINVIGCFGLRTYENESDDTIPVLQIRKGIVKAAGDRTLERVLALAAKSFVDSFTDVVLRELHRRPASALLRHIGEEASTLLRELPPMQQQQQELLSPPRSLPIGFSGGREPTYDPISIANALFFDRMSKFPLLCIGLFNNYPTLKFFFDFSALALSVDEGRTGCKESMRLCTYQREKDERGLAFLFPRRLLAYTWLWSAAQMQPPTVRDSWVQYTLNEYAQSRERRVQQWLEASPAAKVMLGNAKTTSLFLEHLNNLHSEIVRARTTSTEDSVSWASVQEYSYDSKLYRIFMSPICGPLLTTVKEQKGDTGKGSGGSLQKKQQQHRSRSSSKPSLSMSGARSAHDSNDAVGARADKDGTNSQQSTSGSQSGLEAAAKGSAKDPSITSSPSSNNAAAAATAATAIASHRSHSSKQSSAHRRAQEDSATTSTSSVAGGSSLGPQPPSYSTLARGAYPVFDMPVYPTQQAFQPMYLQPLGGIAVPTTQSGASWVVPQFLTPPSSSISSAASPENSFNQVPLPPPLTAGSSAASATPTTYILQIGSDGKQTLMPVAIGPNAQMNSGSTPTLPSPYHVQGIGTAPLAHHTTVITPDFPPPSRYPAPHPSPPQQQQQHHTQPQPPTAQLFPLAAAGGASAGVYYPSAASYAPASYIGPFQAHQPVYPATLSTVAVPQSVPHSFFQPQTLPSALPSSVSVNVGGATASQQNLPRSASSINVVPGVQVQVHQTPPPSYPMRTPQTFTHTSASALQVNQKALYTPQQQHLAPQRDSNVSEEIELFANALRLLD